MITAIGDNIGALSEVAKQKTEPDDFHSREEDKKTHGSPGKEIMMVLVTGGTS